ncbi:hypothetical protein F511_05112 [Dorcoceras hygrometricum]|uniref:Uncharacterized protein n=1 Tax=Dorcoceras hygrometricum TaxID=472368 RepID=A0A2Z7AMG9_9LAMI|nr:hypothetical protein F511_05112 [Dorcoceras hygrometricum]
MASSAVCELPLSCASVVHCGSRLEPWLGPGESAEPGVVQPVGLGHGRPEQGGRRLEVGVVACIEHDGPLGSLGLNGAGDDPVDFIPTDGSLCGDYEAIA